MGTDTGCLPMLVSIETKERSQGTQITGINVDTDNDTIYTILKPKYDLNPYLAMSSISIFPFIYLFYDRCENSTCSPPSWIWTSKALKSDQTWRLSKSNQRICEHSQAIFSPTLSLIINQSLYLDRTCGASLQFRTIPLILGNTQKSHFKTS